MQPTTLAPSISLQHLVVVRPEPLGQFTARVVGIPEMQATAMARDEAIQQVRKMLREWLESGQLVPVEVSGTIPPLRSRGLHEPNDPLEKEFLEDLERFRQEDLERTLQEYDQECSNSSSTPTT